MIIRQYWQKADITIRQALSADVPTFLAWMNDPEIQQTFTSKPRVFSLAGQTHQIEKMLKSERPKLFIFAVLLHEKIIGRLKLSKINWQKRSAHVSILLSPEAEYRGKGYGTNSLEVLFEIARDLGIKTLISKVDQQNFASIKIHEKTGFQDVDNNKIVESLRTYKKVL